MLVVDDEPENVEFLKRMFRRDYDVEVAQSGTEALSRLEAEPFDVIITDQMMPGMTGTELLTRSISLAPDAIRILVTGFPDLETAISSINEGRAYRFFTKPIDRRELVGAVNSALDQLRAGEVLQRQIDALTAERDALRARLDELERNVAAEVDRRAAAVVEELARLRERDPFDDETLLYCKSEMVRRVEEELARSERFGLLCSFALLRVVGLDDLPDPSVAIDRMSDLLRLAVRRFDDAARWSRDTFALLMPHTDQKGAEAAVARLHALAASDDDGAPPLPLEGAIAVYPATGTTADELIAEVERVLGAR